MELLSANEGAFRLPVFLVLKKKKKKIALFYFGSSAPPPCLPPISYLGWIKSGSSGTWNIIVYIQLLLRVVVNRGGFWAGNQKWNRVSLPVGSDSGPQYRRHWLAGEV